MPFSVRTYSSQVSAGLKRPQFLPRSYDLSVRVNGAVNVHPQGGQRAFDQIMDAVLRLGHRRGLVNGQRFLEQINRLIARTVERLDRLLHPLASLRESCRRHRFELRLEFLGRAELSKQLFPQYDKKAGEAVCRARERQRQDFSSVTRKLVALLLVRTRAASAKG